MSAQKLSFAGLETEVDISVAQGINHQKHKEKKKKRRYMDAQENNQMSEAAAAFFTSNARPASAADPEDQASKRMKSEASASSKKKKKTTEEKAASKAFHDKLEKYKAVQGPLFGKDEIKKTHNSSLKKEMKLADAARTKHAEAAARAEILLPSSTGILEASSEQDRTWRITQSQLKENVDSRTASKMFELKLDEFGPYQATYTRNGRHMLLAGRRGHAAMLNTQTFGLEGELQLKEQVNDIKFLHDETMYAVAQKKYVYIYDRTGMELHVLRQHFDVNVLEFLPYHFLLASVGRTGYLKYQDTSTGQFLCEHRTKLGECKVMKQNPSNAVLCLGHNNGTVTMWTPNMNQAVVTIKCHKAPVLALGVDIGGNMLATSGLDGQVKIFDIRTYKEVHSYFSLRPANAIDVSDQGLLALGFGPHVQVWKDAFRVHQSAPYMSQLLPGKIVKSVEFQPYEDVLGVGHSQGFTSLVIPGAGEANFDSYEANPFQTNKQRREATVHSLLEKLQPDMITLDQNMFGMMSKSSKVIYEGQRKDMRDARAAQQVEKAMAVNRSRGKNKSTKKVKRKQANIIDAARVERQENAEKIKVAQTQRKKEAERLATGKPKNALDRFGN